MPVRNVVPKPVQKPHPPLWVACSNRETIHLAAQLGMGALTFAFIDPGEARHWVSDYYETFKKECVPIGHAVNPNIAMVTGFSCHADAEEAKRRGTDGFRFFQFALGHHYVFGRHTPGRTNIWNKYIAVRDQVGTDALGGGTGCIGTPDQLRESLELFASAVMPEFKEREAERVKQKTDELAPNVEAAFKRKAAMPPLADGDIPAFPAYGLTVTEAPDLSKMPEANRRRYLTFQKMREIAERA
jgi:alkanesulfonate monooxygenase SsuD/methylene tetrahydromethanopterin reductase-like flavin-dependent oxidoreductase (luciferase family)